jgi:hypothetical protein
MVNKSKQLFDIFGCSIGKMPLKVCPDKLIGVKLWGIPWKAFWMNAGVFNQESLDLSAFMSGVAIPEQDDISPKVP